MDGIVKEKIDAAMRLIEPGLIKYLWLQDNLHTRDVAACREYQRKFNNFYKVRRNKEWQAYFYRLLESAKKAGLSYDSALSGMHVETNRIEASFSSKLVATLHPNMPVIDKFVLSNFSLKLPSKTSRNRMLETISVYNELERKIHEFISTSIGEYLIASFKNTYPQEKITEVKMVDLVFWKIR